MTQPAADDPPDDVVWLIDVMIAKLDGHIDHLAESVLDRTGGDVNELAKLVGMALAISVELGCALAGDPDEFRRRLRDAAVMHQLDGVGITD